MRLMRTTVVVLALLFSAASAWAQTDMAFFLTPRIGAGQFPDTFRPKYTDPGSLGAGNDLGAYSAMDYGFEGLFFVKADLTAAQRTALSAQTDVLVVPANIDSTVSALALSRIQTTLEAANLPAEWVDTSLTYRQVLRRVRRIITFMQRWQGLFGDRLFVNGVTLDTRWNQLGGVQQQRLRDVAASLQLDTTGITNTSTLRQILRTVADQLPDITLGGVAL